MRYSEIYMRYIGYIIVLLIIGILLPVSMAQPNTPNPRVISLNITTVGDDTYNNGIILIANVSLNVPGNIRYVEEYYKISGNSNPIFVSSKEYYNGGLSQNINANGTFYNTTFQFLRPRSNLGKNYQIIKEIVLLNNIRIFENWNDRNQTFNDNTPEALDDETFQSENIAAHETREQMLGSYPSTFRYTSLDSIYEINATGKGETSIRIDIFKDAPMATYLSNGVVYRYINLGTDNLDIYNLSFRYKTEISWVQNQSIKTIGLFVWKDDEKRWDGLPTTIINQDSEFLYLESVSNSSQLSSTNNYFAIIGFGPSLPSSNKALSNPNLINNNTVNNTIANNITNNNISNNSNSSGNSGNSGSGIGNVSNNYSSISVQNITPVQTDEPLIKNVPGFDFLITIIVILLMAIRSKKDK